MKKKKTPNNVPTHNVCNVIPIPCQSEFLIYMFLNKWIVQDELHVCCNSVPHFKLKRCWFQQEWSSVITLADAPQADDESAPAAQADGEQGVADGDAAPAAEGATEADTPQETQGNAPQETQGDAPQETQGDAPQETQGDATQDAPAEGQGETQGEAPEETPAAEPPTEPPTESQQPQADTGGDGEPKPQDASPQQQPEGGETQADGGGAEETEGEKGEESKEEVDENLIPKDFFYDYEEHSSKPVIAEDSGLPNDMLKLLYPLKFSRFI